MVLISDGDEEPLDGDPGFDDGYDDSEDEDNTSTADGNYVSEEEGEEDEGDSATSANTDTTDDAVPLASADYREDLGILKATRTQLALPGVGFEEGSDDGRLAGLAAVDRFGLFLVSSATGVRVCVCL